MQLKHHDRSIRQYIKAITSTDPVETAAAVGLGCTGDKSSGIRRQRVGDGFRYAKTNKSFGLTTLRDRHVDISGSTIRFKFRGKSGVNHDIEVSDRRLAKIVKRCQDIPG